jgi:hypothetical protein
VVEGPQNFTGGTHQEIVTGPDEMVHVPPGHYVVIANPVVRGECRAPRTAMLHAHAHAQLLAASTVALCVVSITLSPLTFDWSLTLDDVFSLHRVQTARGMSSSPLVARPSCASETPKSASAMSWKRPSRCTRAKSRTSPSPRSLSSLPTRPCA